MLTHRSCTGDAVLGPTVGEVQTNDADTSSEDSSQEGGQIVGGTQRCDELGPAHVRISAFDGSFPPPTQSPGGGQAMQAAGPGQHVLHRSERVTGSRLGMKEQQS